MGFPAQLDRSDPHHPHLMTRRSLQQANEYFSLIVTAFLFVVFLLAMGLMFVHPTGALFTFFSGLALAGVAAVIESFIRRAERRAVQREIHTGASHEELRGG